MDDALVYADTSEALVDQLPNALRRHEGQFC
jgi:hypothetical protein